VERVNYNGIFPYLNEARGEYRVKTLPVKTLPPNPWGLYEMHGNVLEWCADWYAAYDSAELIDPEGAKEDSRNRVLRGGCWINNGMFTRSASRERLDPSVRQDFIGFRLVLGRQSVSIDG
jgi:formylglycine-generating enzyme required for sulfatase activity